MNWYFDNEKPIYKQLVEQLKVFIINGKYPPGSKMTSVRDLAFESRVNPNTMQKALQELENIGLMYTMRTSGRFITEDKKLIEKIRKEMALEIANQFISGMDKIGIDKQEVIKYLEEEMKWQN